MKIIFLGTSQFAIPSLSAIFDAKHEILAVITQPDRRKGRNLLVSPTDVKVLAGKYNLPVYQPYNISDLKMIELLKKFNADLFVVVSYGQILSKEILDIPEICAINLHGSLLPKYRGAAPINWAIINGEKKTGVTIIKMNRQMDRGDIILKKEIKVDESDTAISLADKLSRLGADLIIKTICLFKEGEVPFTPQDEGEASYAPKLKKEDGKIEWSKSAVQIRNHIRGTLPWPGAFTSFNGKLLKILEVEISSLDRETTGRAGRILEVIQDKEILVNTGQGCVVIKCLQLEGGKRMSTKEFLVGHKISVGGILG